MNEPANITRPPNAVRRTKAAKRPSPYREKLLEIGASLFVERGITQVSVEQLVDKAGVSRATFYGFFANKNELAAAILLPVFDSGTEVLESLDKLSPQEAAESLIDAYLYLWKAHRNALLLTGNFDGAVFPYIKTEHDAFNAKLEKVLRVLESGGLLKNDSAELTLQVLAKTAIPLLRVYKDYEDLESIYRDSMLGLIIKV